MNIGNNGSKGKKNRGKYYDKSNSNNDDVRICRWCE